MWLRGMVIGLREAVVGGLLASPRESGKMNFLRKYAKKNAENFGGFKNSRNFALAFETQRPPKGNRAQRQEKIENASLAQLARARDL